MLSTCRLTLAPSITSYMVVELTPPNGCVESHEGWSLRTVFLTVKTVR